MMDGSTSDQAPRLPWLMIALSLPALAILIALGTWQVQRLAWKEELLAKIEERLYAAPTDVGEIADALRQGALSQPDIDYLPAQATGVFNHAAEQHFFATHNGISGYFVYTPLELIEPVNTVLFVNRGFVPFDLKEREARPHTAVPGIQNIRGLARQRLEAKPSFIVPDNDPAANIFYWKDLALMSERAGYGDGARVLPFFLDAGFPDRPGELGRWPVDGVTRIDLPNNHLQYAVTWYGLAVTLVVVVAVFIGRRLRGR